MSRNSGLSLSSRASRKAGSCSSVRISPDFGLLGVSSLANFGQKLELWFGKVDIVLDSEIGWGCTEDLEEDSVKMKYRLN